MMCELALQISELFFFLSVSPLSLCTSEETLMFVLIYEKRDCIRPSSSLTENKAFTSFAAAAARFLQQASERNEKNAEYILRVITRCVVDEAARCGKLSCGLRSETLFFCCRSEQHNISSSECDLPKLRFFYFSPPIQSTREEKAQERKSLKHSRRENAFCACSAEKP